MVVEIRKAALVARIVAGDEVHLHRGEVSYEDDDDMSADRFDDDFELSDELFIMPKFFPRYRPWTARDHFPWFLGVEPIDYESRLEAELTRHWGGFEKHEEDNVVVGRVDDIEIYRSVPV